MDYTAQYKRRDAAARRIQAAWRAYKSRRAFLRMRDAASKIQAVAKGWYVRKQVQQIRGRQELEARFNTVMEKRREKIRVLEGEKRALLALPGGELEEWEARRMRAAIRVQAHWRGLVARRKMAQSPERLRREEAARRIQSAFKRMLHSKRASSAFAGVLDRSRSPSPSSPELRGRAGAGGAGPGGVRQSGASVLLGSPQINPSSPITSPGLSPQARAAGAAGAPGAGMPRTIEVIGAKRYKQLLTQVDGKLAAYVALAKSRGAARRPDPRATDARLAELLRAYHVSAPTRQAAAHTRQHNLVVVDSLCAQLEQIRPLSELPPDAAPQDFPRPPRGSQRAERAATAHALGLAEAKAGSRWWAHLKGLNNKAAQDAMLVEDMERWEDMDAAWRRMWDQLEEQENRRPDIVEELRPRSGMGAAALAAAKEEAAREAKLAEYARRAMEDGGAAAAAAAAGAAAPSLQWAPVRADTTASYTSPTAAAGGQPAAADLGLPADAGPWSVAGARERAAREERLRELARRAEEVAAKEREKRGKGAKGAGEGAGGLQPPAPAVSMSWAPTRVAGAEDGGPAQYVTPEGRRGESPGPRRPPAPEKAAA